MEVKKLADPKVLLGIGAALGAVWLLAPNAAAGLLSLAVIAACPLGMLLMMKAMGGMMGGQKERTDGQPSDAGARERELAELRAEVEALQRDRTARPGSVERPDAGGAGPTGPAG